MVLFALLRSKSDAGTAASDCQQYWALFGLRVYAARGAAGLAQHLQSLVALRQISCSSRRVNAFSRARGVGNRRPAWLLDEIRLGKNPHSPMKSSLSLPIRCVQHVTRSFIARKRAYSQPPIDSQTRSLPQRRQAKSSSPEQRAAHNRCNSSGSASGCQRKYHKESWTRTTTSTRRPWKRAPAAIPAF